MTHRLLMKHPLLRTALAVALALAPVGPKLAHAAASLQTTHAFLCAPLGVAQAPGPRRVVNSSSTASPQPSYQLNAAGCALIAGADIGFFLSQGFSYGPNIFTLQQTGITASTTSSTSTITLPAYAIIDQVVLTETAGHAITGGIDLGDANSATTFASAVALGANGTVDIVDSALTRLPVTSGVPAADQILVACHTSCNSGSVNITILYSYW